VADQTPRAGASTRGRWLRMALGVGLTVGILVYIFGWRIRYGDLTGALGRVSFGWVAVAVALVIFNRVLMSFKWWMLLGAQGVRISPWTLTSVQFTSYFLGVVLPGVFGSDVVRSWILAKAHGKVAATLASVLVDRVTSLLSLALVAAAGLWWVGDGLPGRRVIIALALLGCAGFVAAAAGARPLGAVLQTLSGRSTGRVARLAHKAQRLLDAVRVYNGRPGVVAAALLWGVLVQGVRCLGIYTLFLALGRGGLLIECIALVPVIAFVGMFPPAMSHLAVNAGTTVALFGRYGVPEADALVVSVINSGAILLLIPIGAACYWLGPRVGPGSGTVRVTPAT
jgi:glycosyltransferase 2 family protein